MGQCWVQGSLSSTSALKQEISMKSKGIQKQVMKRGGGQQTPHGKRLQGTHFLIKQLPSVCQVPGFVSRSPGTSKGCGECLPGTWVYSSEDETECL